MTHILAIDTATPMQSVALLHDDTLLATRTAQQKQNHSTSLLRQIDDMLQGVRLSKAELGLIAVAIGPGSFTALRVGLATAKALSLGTDTPIVGISSLAAMAYHVARLSPGKIVWAGLDARRQELYAGAYQWTNDQLAVTHPEGTYAPEALATLIQQSATSGPCCWLGYKTQHYEAINAMDPKQVHTLPPACVTPNAVGVGLLGLSRLTQHGPDDRHTLEPNYIRPSDAELSWRQRQSTQESP